MDRGDNRKSSQKNNKKTLYMDQHIKTSENNSQYGNNVAQQDIENPG